MFSIPGASGCVSSNAVDGVVLARSSPPRGVTVMLSGRSPSAPEGDS